MVYRMSMTLMDRTRDMRPPLNDDEEGYASAQCKGWKQVAIKTALCFQKNHTEFNMIKDAFKIKLKTKQFK